MKKLELEIFKHKVAMVNTIETNIITDKKYFNTLNKSRKSIKGISIDYDKHRNPITRDTGRLEYQIYNVSISFLKYDEVIEIDSKTIHNLMGGTDYSNNIMPQAIRVTIKKEWISIQKLKSKNILSNISINNISTYTTCDYGATYIIKQVQKYHYRKRIINNHIIYYSYLDDICIRGLNLQKTIKNYSIGNAYGTVETRVTKSKKFNYWNSFNFKIKGENELLCTIWGQLSIEQIKKLSNYTYKNKTIDRYRKQTHQLEVELKSNFNNKYRTDLTYLEKIQQVKKLKTKRGNKDKNRPLLYGDICYFINNRRQITLFIKNLLHNNIKIKNYDKETYNLGTKKNPKWYKPYIEINITKDSCVYIKDIDINNIQTSIEKQSKKWIEDNPYYLIIMYNNCENWNITKKINGISSKNHYTNYFIDTVTKNIIKSIKEYETNK